MFALELKGRKKNWLRGIIFINMQVKRRVLMVNGSWIQNVCMLKMRFLIVQLSITIVLQQLNSGQVVEDKWKLVQFATIFNLLSKGKPMINYEDL